MNGRLWRYEVQRIGWMAFLTLLLALAVLSSLAFLAGRLGMGGRLTAS